MVEELIESLKCFENKNFKFDPSKHAYTFNGKSYTSVTKFIQNFHKKFDEEYWSKKKSEDYGIDQSELLKQWKDKNEYANVVGHGTHDWIENYFNSIYQSIPTNLDIVDRINKFNIIYATHLNKLTPVKFELRVFSKKYPLAGTIDSIFLYKGRIFILDWKTNGVFTDDNHKKGRFENLLHPFEDFYKNHLNEYSIQVSLYSLILEEWGFNVGGAYLVHIGPDSEATIHKSIDMRPQLNNFLTSYSF